MNEVFFVGPLPPPITGFSSVNSRVFNILSVKTNVFCFDRSKFTGWSLVGAASAVLRFAFLALLKKDAVLYLALSGGYGQLVDIPFLLIARIFRLPIFIHHHTFSYLVCPTWFSRVTFFVTRSARHIVLCDSMAESICRVFNVERNRIFVVTNAAFQDDIDFKDVKIDRSFNKFGYLSNITAGKGVFKFFDLMSRLEVLMPGIKGYIAGPLDKNIEEQFFLRLSRCSSVSYLGPIYGDDKDSFFRDIDILVFPSTLNEAEPVTIIESLKYGVPVFAIARGCIAGLVNDAGLVLDDDDFENVVLSFSERFLESIEFCSNFRRSARRRFEYLKSFGEAELNRLVFLMLEDN